MKGRFERPAFRQTTFTVPETGKRLATLEQFQAGLPAFIYRYDRSPYENAVVEQRALSNLGGPYIAPSDNCEQMPGSIRQAWHSVQPLMALASFCCVEQGQFC